MLSSDLLPAIISLLLGLLIVHHSLVAAKSLSREDFPDDFVFGTASSAYQYEGAAREGGKGISLWDTFTSVKGNIVGNANGNVADDEYHRYKEDISLMSDMGVDAYRFSISWPRIYPEGKGEVNEEGVAYYKNLIDGLLEKGIQPFVTLYHGDLPQKLEDAFGSWLSSLIVDDFANYANTCFARFGDRVKHWTTFNEPLMFILYGYDSGTVPPQRCSPWVGNCSAGDSATEPYIAGHNVLLSHAKAVDVYRTKYQKHQKGVIGLTTNVNWYIPFSNSTKDVEAVERIIDFTFGWYLDPILSGHYPTIMQEIVGKRLPTFAKDEQHMLHHSLDFLGVNYYTSYYVKAIDSYEDLQHTDFFKDIMANTTGVDELNNASLSLKQALHDPVRVKFLQDHLFYLKKSIKEGVDVRGYFVWSLLDNFEWREGYSVRFGLYFVDYETLRRYPKDSANCLPLAASGGMDGKLMIWDLQTLSPRHICQHEEGVVRLIWCQSC